MKGKYVYLSQNILLFSIGGFVPKVLSFILVPLYTSYLTTAEYGISDLITTTVQLLIPIFTLGIQDAVMRFAMEKNYQKENVFSTALRIILSGFLIIFIGVCIISRLNIQGLNDTYLLFFLIMYLTNAINNTVSLFCRAIDKIKVMVCGSIINSIITLGLNILFLIFFKWGLTGYLIANSVGALGSLIYCFLTAKLYCYVKLDNSKELCREMVRYSFPLIFSSIAWWVNNASDRYILSWLSGVAISGVYAVAYKIPNLLSIFQNIFTQAWSISAIKEFDKDDSDGFIGNMYIMMNFAMVIMCSFIMIMDIPLAKVLYSNDFYEAWKFVPLLLLSVVFNAMALFIGGIFTAVKDTKTLSISTIVGALVNTICNFIFIYFWGAYGAALATMIGYFVTLIMRHIILKKHICMKVNMTREIGVYCLLLIQAVTAMIGLKLIPIQVLILCLIFFLYRYEIRIVKKMVAEKIKR